MTCSVLVVGVPMAACDPAVTWRAAASFVQQRLAERFGQDVTYEYAELFGPEMARHPGVEAAIAEGEAVPPIVVIDGVRRFSGGKLNISAIERAVAEALALTHPPTDRALSTTSVASPPPPEPPKDASRG